MNKYLLQFIAKKLISACPYNGIAVILKWSGNPAHSIQPEKGNSHQTLFVGHAESINQP